MAINLEVVWYPETNTNPAMEFSLGYLVFFVVVKQQKFDFRAANPLSILSVFMVASAIALIL